MRRMEARDVAGDKLHCRVQPFLHRGYFGAVWLVLCLYHCYVSYCCVSITAVSLLLSLLRIITSRAAFGPVRDKTIKPITDKSLTLPRAWERR